MNIEFIMDDQQLSTALAIGAVPRSIVIEPCALAVGDLISFSDFPAALYRVHLRYYVAEQKQWQIELRQAKPSRDGD
jgi:hypothetical protein